VKARRQHREALIEPTRNGHHVIWPTIVTGLALIALGFVLRVSPIDAPVVQALNTTHVGAWGQAADAIYLALEPLPSALLTLLIISTIAVVCRSLRTAIVFGGIIALTWLPTAAIKLVVDRPRPDPLALAHPFSPAQVDGSFPSGHTAFVAALAIAFWFLLRTTRWAALVVIAGITATSTIGLAVISDGLHYPSDVAASIVWALAMAPSARWIMVDLIPARWLERTRQNVGAL
jgi:membrane-associated phospholipid phosphatase